MQKLELYLHIPFCVKKCHYCDFLSAPADEKTIQQYVDALCWEIESYGELAKNYELGSIFFGGGTPSLLTPKQFEAIFSCIRRTFRLRGEIVTKEAVAEKAAAEEVATEEVATEEAFVEEAITEEAVTAGAVTEKTVAEKVATSDCEITVECNPGTVRRELLHELKKLGVNRLSFGLQSANKEELKTLGRIHSYEDFTESYQLAREVGFYNINIDLMQAIPTQTTRSFLDTLKKVIALEPEHISAYSLILEEGTPFYEWYQKNLEELPSEETERKIYELAEEFLRKAGYEHYEISNYAKKGYECRHNCGYWTGVEYLGLGLGASSYIKETRFEQTKSLHEYLTAYRSDSFDHTKKILKKLFRVMDDYSCFKDKEGIRLDAMVDRNKEKQCSFANYREIHALSKKEQMEEFMFLGLRLTCGIRTDEFEKRFKISYESVYGELTRKLLIQGLLLVIDDGIASYEISKKDIIGTKIAKARIALSKRGRDVSNHVLAEFLLET